ncbi:MAG: hypothetical protein HQ523_01230 [Lentisphaerae bacterium]|nr:hypothetical protein [Lentisphaerota bacterium]
MQLRPEEEINLIDHGFMASRAKLLDIAAFLDRIERSGQARDYRVDALCEAIKLLDQPGALRARRILEALSDPSQGPIPEAHTKDAAGAYQGPAS